MNNQLNQEVKNIHYGWSYYKMRAKQVYKSLDVKAKVMLYVEETWRLCLTMTGHDLFQW